MHIPPPPHAHVHMYIQVLDHEAQRLLEEQPTSAALIEEKQAEIIENWEQLTQRADERYVHTYGCFITVLGLKTSGPLTGS